MVSVDSLDLERVDLIKLDVEGHELAVLRGGRAMLARDLPILLVELEERFGAGSIARVHAFMESFGYRGLFLDHRHLYPIAMFDPRRFQKMEQWSQVGAYINNFIFITERDYPSIRARLAGIGYPAPP